MSITRCNACHPDGWQCERLDEGHVFHACAISGPDPRLDENGEPVDAERVWEGTTRWRETQNRVLDAWEDSPAATTSDLAKCLNLNVWTVRRHLRSLRQEGLVL